MSDQSFESLMRRPVVAWPTVALFLAAWSLYATGVLGYVQGWLPVWATVSLNAVATYWLFTVFHDASHNAVSQHKWLNDWIGRISILTFSPFPVFRGFRFIHMQHHRFANEDKSLDPDGWCGGGRWWTLPFRWATLDIYYYVFYLPKLGDRPASERRESIISIVLACSTLAALIAAGHGIALLVCWFVPARIAIVFLAFAFDWLPHYPHDVAERDNRYRATSNRIGLEWLITPLLLYQNYHLVHHLYPRAPFYRYIRLWHAREAEHLARNPYLQTPLGRPLDSADGITQTG